MSTPAGATSLSAPAGATSLGAPAGATLLGAPAGATALGAPAGATLNRRRLLLVLPALLVLGGLVVLPYANILVMSLRPPATGAPYGQGFTTANYLQVVGDPYYRGLIGQTLLIGLMTTAASLLLAFPVAWQIARSRSRWRAVGYGVVLSPLLVGIVVRSFGWTILLGRNGAINKGLRALGMEALPLMYNSFGVTLALTHVFLPFMILPLSAALQTINPGFEAAARSLGAGRATVFRRIVLPLAMPGVQSGCIMVFVLSISAYVTPVLIGGMRVKTMPITVVDTLIDAFQWPLGAAQALVLAACGGACVLVFSRLVRGGRLA